MFSPNRVEARLSMTALALKSCDMYVSTGSSYDLMILPKEKQELEGLHEHQTITSTRKPGVNFSWGRCMRPLTPSLRAIASSL
jgi:hypothetical protein